MKNNIEESQWKQIEDIIGQEAASCLRQESELANGLIDFYNSLPRVKRILIDGSLPDNVKLALYKLK